MKILMIAGISKIPRISNIPRISKDFLRFGGF
jgi:hypothetical protein